MTDKHGRKVVVVDNGSAYMKAGFAGENIPSYMFPTVLGKPIVRSNSNTGMSGNSLLVGEECSNLDAKLDMKFPIYNGVVRDWESMAHIWDYTFSPEKLDIDPKNCKILLTEPPLNPASNRKKMCQVMFEQYEFHSVNISVQAVLALYAQGLMTGVVVDIGDGATHVVPVYDGYTIKSCIQKLEVGGRDITNYLMELLLYRGYSFNRTADFYEVQKIKENYCYVALKLEDDRKLAEETTCLSKYLKTSDGRKVRIAGERFEAPEVLFQPHLTDIEKPGLGEMLFNVIQSTDIDVRLDLYKHIVISGGSTMFPEFPSRVERELKQQYFKKVLKNDKDKFRKFKIHVEAPLRRNHLVFTGGAFLADLMRDNDSDFWISKAEYEEKGIEQCLARLV